MKTQKQSSLRTCFRHPNAAACCLLCSALVICRPCSGQPVALGFVRCPPGRRLVCLGHPGRPQRPFHGSCGLWWWKGGGERHFREKNWKRKQKRKAVFLQFTDSWGGGCRPTSCESWCTSGGAGKMSWAGPCSLWGWGLYRIYVPPNLLPKRRGSGESKRKGISHMYPNELIENRSFCLHLENVSELEGD